MKIRITLFLGVIFSILMGTGLVLAQEQATQSPPAQETPSEPETLWIWGDVVSVDTANKKVSVKYLDYETDTEKEINIDVEDATTFENVKSLAEIKPMDTVSIDYVTNPEGRNIARNISVEKPEGEQVAPGQATEEQNTAPAAGQ